MKLSLLFFILLSSALFGGDIIGFWKITDQDTNKPRSIIAIYEYRNKYYGRLIATYDKESGEVYENLDHRIERAPGVKRHPFYVGLDILWNLRKEGDKYVDGTIMDPEKGRIYDAEAWVEDGHLVLRGKLLFFGQNQKWPAINEKSQAVIWPNLDKLVPQIPKVN